MKRIMLGLIAGGVAGYFARKMHQEGQFDKLYDEINDLGTKTKQKFQDVVEMGKEKMESMKHKNDLADQGVSTVLIEVESDDCI